VISTLPRALVVRRHNQPLALLVATTLLLALAGSVWSATVLVRGVDEDTRRANSPTVGQPVNTSFGSLRVDYVEHVKGLSDEDMGGAMPGMQGMVHADSEAVIAYVTYANNLRRPVEVRPDQFRLITDTSDTPVVGAGSPLGTGDVQPGSALQTSFRFVIPRDEAHLWLEYRDPGNGPGLRFALGTAEQPPADGQGEHTH
jgi:hypothetical protein